MSEYLLAHRFSGGLLSSTTAHPSCKPFTRIYTLLLGMLYSQKCRSYSPPRSRSGTAHPSSSWCREAQVAAASHAWRGHPTDSHMCWQEEIMMSEVLNLVLLFSLFFKKRIFFAGRNVDISTPKRGSDSLWLDQISLRHPWDVIATTASPQLSLKTFCNLPRCTHLTSQWTFCHVFQHGKKQPKSKVYIVSIDCM